MKPYSIDHFLGKELVLDLVDSPEAMTYIGVFDRFDWLTRHNSNLSIPKKDDRENSIKQYEQVIRTLYKYDDSSLSQVQRNTKKIALFDAENNLKQVKEFPHHDYPLNQIGGVHLNTIEFLSDIKNLGSNSILYVTGDSVVLSSNAGTAMESVGDALMANTGLGWRELFDTVAIPGFIIVPALFFIVRDPGRSEDGSSRAERRKLRRSQKRMLDAKRLLRKTRFLGVKKDKETGKLTEKSVSDLNIVSLVASYEEDKTPRFIARKARKAEDEAAANVSALAVRKAIKADDMSS